MPIRPLRHPKNSSSNNQAPAPIPALPAQEEIPLPQEPPPIPADDTIYFVTTTYSLPDGQYIGAVIQSKLPDDRTRLLMVFELEDGTQFLVTQRLPLNTNTAFGKEMYKQSCKRNGKGIIFPEVFIGATATFEIVNRTYNNKTYSNIAAIKFAWDFGNNDTDNEGEGDGDNAD